MDKERILENLEWCPPGKRRKGRPRNSWMLEVTTGKWKKGINNIEWIDMEEWRRNNTIKTLGTEMCKNPW